MATASPIINSLCRRSIVEQATGESRSTIYRKIQKGLFTKPVQIGGDRVAWPQNEVQAIINARIAGKSDDEIKALVIELEAARNNIGAEVKPMTDNKKAAPVGQLGTASKSFSECHFTLIPYRIKATVYRLAPWLFFMGVWHG